MNKSLQELIYLFMYQSENEMICEIYFKGRLEPYAVVKADELLGDILFLCSQKNNVNVYELWNDNEIFTQNGYTYVSFNDEWILEVASVIVSDYLLAETSSFDDEFEVQNDDIVEDTIDFLDIIQKKDLQYNERVFNAFKFFNRYYLPPCTMKPIKRNEVSSKMFLPEILYMDFSMDKMVESVDIKNNIYCYECDDTNEVIMALMHYIAISNRNLKRCDCCGRFFSPGRTNNQKYCYRKINDQTCKKIGTHRTRAARMVSDSVSKKYNSVNTNLARQARSKKISKDERILRENKLYEFRDLYNINKSKLSDKELLDWMNSYLTRNKKV